MFPLLELNFIFIQTYNLMFCYYKWHNFIIIVIFNLIGNHKRMTKCTLIYVYRILFWSINHAWNAKIMTINFKFWNINQPLCTVSLLICLLRYLSAEFAKTWKNFPHYAIEATMHKQYWNPPENFSFEMMSEIKEILKD